MNTLTLTPGISVRRLDLSEYKDAASLSLEIYLQTGEEDFDEQGLETFKSFVNDEAMINSLVIYGAFDEARLVGVMAVKDEGETYFPVFHTERISPERYRQKIIRCFYRRDFCAGNDCKFLYVCSAFLQKFGI